MPLTQTNLQLLEVLHAQLHFFAVAVKNGDVSDGAIVSVGAYFKNAARETAIHGRAN